MVVGAGPTGLTLAAELQRREVPCLLIDALDAPLGWDRATVVHERTLQIFEALGIVEPFLAEGVATRGARFHSDGRVLAELRLDLTASRYGFQLGVSEEFTESVLTAHLAAQGGAVTRSTRLVGLQPGAEAVVATLERDGRRTQLTFPWVVGCDGGRSGVREAAGIGFPGTDIEAPWAVFDTTLEGWKSDYDLVSVHLDVPPVILTPLPGRRWRVYLRPRSGESDLVAEATDVIAHYAPAVRLTEIERPTRFHCHSRIADRYRSGRVLIAGDAAHACTPAEGHGMNTGVQDAFNLGWKLALVCRGDASADLLDTYEAERHPVAERVVSSGDAVEAAQALTDAEDRSARDADIGHTFGDPEQAHHEAVAASELDYTYPSSRAIAGSAGAADLVPGRLLPDTEPVEPGDGTPRPLPDLAQDSGFTLLVLGGPRAEPARVSEVVTELQALRHPTVGNVVGLSVDPNGSPVGRMSEPVAARLGVEGVTVLAVRPDRYVGLRDDGGDGTAAVRDYLEGLVG